MINERKRSIYRQIWLAKSTYASKIDSSPILQRMQKKNLDDRQNCTFNVDNFFFQWHKKNGIHYRINMQKSASSLSMDSHTAYTTIPNKRWQPSNLVANVYTIHILASSFDSFIEQFIEESRDGHGECDRERHRETARVRQR